MFISLTLKFSFSISSQRKCQKCYLFMRCVFFTRSKETIFYIIYGYTSLLSMNIVCAINNFLLGEGLHLLSSDAQIQEEFLKAAPATDGTTGATWHKTALQPTYPPTHLSSGLRQIIAPNEGDLWYELGSVWFGISQDWSGVGDGDDGGGWCPWGVECLVAGRWYFEF